MNAERLKMISSLIHKELAILLQKEVEPILGMISVHEVVLSADCSFADVFVLFLNPNKTQKQLSLDLKVLESKTTMLRTALAKIIKLKYMPKLRFHLDETLLHARKINELLKNVQTAS